MRVQELLQEVKLETYLTRLVKKHGIQKLGGGAFSQVFQHPEFKNVVVKVYTAKDTVYKRYLSWCLKHQSDPYVPKIIKQVEYKSPSGEAYNIVFMQKMTPVKSRIKFARSMASLFKLNTRALEDLDLVRSLGMWGEQEEDFEVIDDLVSAGKADKDFTEVWRHIRTYGKSKFDMHPGNVMFRGNQLVLTDPVANDPTSRIDEI